MPLSRATRAADVDDALTRAAGANYDLGNTRTGVKAGATASIKSASKQFFQQKDKETEIKVVQFEKVRPPPCAARRARRLRRFRLPCKGAHATSAACAQHVRTGKGVSACDLGNRVMTVRALRCVDASR